MDPEGIVLIGSFGPDRFIQRLTDSGKLDSAFTPAVHSVDLDFLARRVAVDAQGFLVIAGSASIDQLGT
jgi:hypothetical protein